MSDKITKLTKQINKLRTELVHTGHPSIEWVAERLSKLEDLELQLVKLQMEKESV